MNNKKREDRQTRNQTLKYGEQRAVRGEMRRGMGKTGEEG